MADTLDRLRYGAQAPLLSAGRPQTVHPAPVSIGDRIRAARKRVGMTQRVLAEHLGVDKSAVAQWENEITGIKTANLIETARILGIRPSELLGGSTRDDQLVLDDPEEIAVVTILRGLPRDVRDPYVALLRAALVRHSISDPPEKIERPIERRRLSA